LLLRQASIAVPKTKVKYRHEIARQRPRLADPWARAGRSCLLAGARLPGSYQRDGAGHSDVERGHPSVHRDSQ